MVGRGDLLSGLLGLCQSGSGSTVVLTGVAGSGKSRLLSELGSLAEADGALVLRGHAVAGGGAFRPVAEALIRVAPVVLSADERLAPFRWVLARILPSWPAGTTGGVHLVDPVVVLGEAVLELLRVIGADRACVLLLDDLHWADQDTLALLEYLAGGVTSLGVTVVAAARDDEVQPPGLLALRHHSAVSTVSLPGLSRADVVELGRMCAGGDLAPDVEDYLVGAADGLPLLVEELFAGLVEAGLVVREGTRWRAAGPIPSRVPGALAELVGRRLHALRLEDADLLCVAAVLGQDLDWTVLPAVTGRDHDAVAVGLRAGAEAGLLLVDPLEGALRWRHALTRDAVLAGLTTPERAAVAGRAADALDAPPGGLHGARLALVADLQARGGRPERAATLMLAQAREHLDAGALAAARSVLEHAVVLASGDPGLALEIAIERVRVLALVARTDEALAVGDAVLPSATGAHRMALAIAVAQACVAAERFAQAGRYLRAAADPGDARVLALSAHVALGSGQLDHSVVLGRQAVEAGLADDVPEAVCEALEVVGRGLRRADPVASHAAFARAEQVAADRGLVPWRIRALSELAIDDMLGGGSGLRLRQVRELAIGAGLLGTATVAEMQLAAVTSAVDGMVASMVTADRCAESARRLGLVGLQAAALLFVARGRVFAGRAEQAQPALDVAESLAPDPVHVHSERWHVRGYDAWLAGDMSAAAAAFDACVAVLREAPGSNPAPVWGEWVVLRTAMDPGDEGPRSELRRSDVLVSAGNVAGLHYADALAACHAGSPVVAEGLLAAGDQLLVEWPFHRYLLRLMLFRPGPGNPGAPAVLLREALAWLEGRGEVRFARWCQERLRQLGEPVPRPARDLEQVPPRLRALGVTGRELQVLRLIVAGLPNPKIAARLHLSRRTVETHVGNLLAKTGATGRGALSGWLPPDSVSDDG